MAPLVTLPPLSVILSWPKPNYVDPVRRGPEIYIINAIMMTLATSAVITRLYARLFVRRWFGLDDAFIVMAWMCAVGVTAAVFVGCLHYSWDRHVWDVPIDEVLPGGKILFTSAICWALSSCFTKLSLLFFYYRLVEHIQFKKYRWVMHILILFQVAFMAAYLLTLIFMCVPIDAFWKYPPNLNATCIHTGDFLFTVSIINTLVELLVWLVPLPLLLHLKLNPKQRLPVTCLLMAGLLVPVVGAVRCYYVYIDIVISWDVYWYSEPQWICSDVENYLALICACAPALRPLIGKWFGFKDASELQDRAKLMSSTRSDGPTTPDSTLQMKYVNAQDLMWFDLEGIADDGLGYSVSITAAKDGAVDGTVKNKKTGFTGLKAKNSMSRLIGGLTRHAEDTSNERLHTREPEIRESRSGSRLKTRNEPEKEFGSGLPKSILTKRTVEIRESFDSDTHGAEENRDWPLHNFKDTAHSFGSSDSEANFEERMDRLGVLPPLEVHQRQQGFRPHTAPAPTHHTNAPQLPEMMFTGSQLPRWLTPPQTPLSRRRYRGDNVIAPRNSSQWWAATFGLDANGDPTVRNNPQAPTRPHTAAASLHPRTRRQVESLMSDSLASDDGSFMREIADLREMLQHGSGAAATGEDGESVVVEDGSRVSGQGPKRNISTAERRAMVESKDLAWDWAEKSTQT